MRLSLLLAITNTLASTSASYKGFVTYPTIQMVFAKPSQTSPKILQPSSLSQEISRAHAFATQQGRAPQLLANAVSATITTDTLLVVGIVAESR
jgi:hypothetical protein